MEPPRAVRIVTEVGAVDRPFDYLVTESTRRVGVGDRVRVDFNHRSVRGWVVAEVDPVHAVKPLGKWLGYGPPPEMLELLAWAGERWYAPQSRFLAAASPPTRVTDLPGAPAAGALAPSVASGGLRVEPGVVLVAPTLDPLAIVLGAYEQCRERPGSLLVVVPTEAWARRLRGRLEQRGVAVAFGEREWDRARAGWPVIVGARGAALAPTPRVAGAVVVDADDDSLRSSATPTWDAATLVRERCRRDDAPVWLTSMMPSPSLLGGEGFRAPRATSRAAGPRSRWSIVARVTRTTEPWRVRHWTRRTAPSRGTSRWPSSSCCSGSVRGGCWRAGAAGSSRGARCAPKPSARPRGDSPATKGTSRVRRSAGPVERRTCVASARVSRPSRVTSPRSLVAP